MPQDLKALDLAQKAQLVADLAFAATDHRLTDMSRLDKAMRDYEEAKKAYLGEA